MAGFWPKTLSLVNSKEICQLFPIHSIKDILEKVLPKNKWASQQRKYALWEAWPQVVGTAIATHAAPLRWVKNTLVIGVQDLCWLQELRMKEQELLSQIRTRFPDLKIDGIRFQVKS